MSADLEYLLDHGVTVEEIARRAGVQPQAITRELNIYRKRKAQDDAHQNTESPQHDRDVRRGQGRP